MSHSSLSPSAAERWCYCPGSVSLSEGMPDSSSSYAKEGTAAHDLLERCLIARNSPMHCIGTIISVEGERFEVTEDMATAVEVAYELVKKEMATVATTELFTERKVHPGALMDRNDLSGTADITLVYDTLIKVWDYKHGAGVLVEARGNLQTLLYGIGALAALEPERRAEIKDIETGIIQPRCSHPDGPIRSVVYPIEVVYQWMMWLISRANACDQPDAELVPGDKQCRWCRAKPKCPAMKSKVLDVFKAPTIAGVEPQVMRRSETLTQEEINLIDDQGDIICAFVEAVRKYKLTQMMNGVHYPGSKLVRGNPGNRKFTEEDEKVLSYVTRNFKIKKVELVKSKILGPAKILAMANKSPEKTDRRINKLESMIVRPEGQVCIAPASDPRPEIQNNLEQIFKDVPQIGEFNE